MKVNVLSEVEWFDTYYPKEWGNWREYFNFEQSHLVENKTGCTIDHYNVYGRATLPDTLGRMFIKTDIISNCIDAIFVEVTDKDIIEKFSPIYQPKDQKYFFSITCNKQKSNLDLYSIDVFNSCNLCYAKDFIGLIDMYNELSNIKNKGISYIINDTSSEFYDF